MFNAILNSAKKAWNGTERLWKVFWLWGILIQFSAVPIGFLALGLWNTCPNQASRIFVMLISFCGLIYVFIYPFIFILTIWKCNKNVKIKWLSVAGKIYIPIFILLHIINGTYSFFGSLWIGSLSINNEQSALARNGCFSYFYENKFHH